MTPDRRTVATLGLVVGMVLADSSVVILALPDILDRFHVAIDTVAWVLTIFNLTMAIAAVPAAYLSRRLPPALVCRAGLVVFGLASLGCALAPGFDWLLAFRVVQAIGGAAAACAALELLPAAAGSELRAIAVWAAAGAIGAAAGPAIGGALTQAISWSAVFLVQVPLAAVAFVLIPRSSAVVEPAAPDRPVVSANVALALVSAALTAALFLIVLLLINGWGHTPLQAAAIVTVMPISAFAAYRLAPNLAPRAGAISGAVLIAGGLAALGLLPGANWAWLIAPQIAIGAGLALAVGALTHEALAGRSPLAIHGGWTMAARHAGVCVGLLILTPLFTHDLKVQQKAAELAGARLVINSSLGFTQKLQLGDALLHQITSGTVTHPPDLRPAFKPFAGATGIAPLEDAIQDEIDKAVTHAFSRSFLVAALLALLATLPLALQPRRA